MHEFIPKLDTFLKNLRGDQKPRKEKYFKG